MLTYSNWEHVTLCFSESFASLSEGLQNALWALGGVPLRHCTDRLTLAVHPDGNPEVFTQKYQALLSHYGLAGEATNPASGHENGDCEQSHRQFKPGAVLTVLRKHGHYQQPRIIDNESRSKHKGPVRKPAYSAAPDQSQSSGVWHRPRLTGLLCIYSIC